MKEIKLSKGYVTQVDDEDFEWLNSFNWVANIQKGKYQRATKNKSKTNEYTKMHRMILGVTDPKIFVDHKDRNPLNNCRSNLRIATKNQNCGNIGSRENSTSKYLGVSWDKWKNRWTSRIVNNGKITCLGYFKNENEAALAYNTKALELRGEFASLNQIV